MNQKHIEVKTISHKNIDVMVSINYDVGTISLVNKGMNFPPKSWVFAGRTVEYMPAWKNILKAMLFAVEVAEKDLQKDIEEKAKQKEELVEFVLKEELKERKSKK